MRLSFIFSCLSGVGQTGDLSAPQRLNAKFKMAIFGCPNLAGQHVRGGCANEISKALSNTMMARQNRQSPKQNLTGSKQGLQFDCECQISLQEFHLVRASHQFI